MALVPGAHAPGYYISPLRGLSDRLIKKDSNKAREEAARAVARGGVIAFRTDTFYGLGADPFNPHAVRKIYELKGREEGKPILVLISDTTDLDRLVDAGESYRSIAFAHWPGPLTLVGVARPELPNELTAGTNSIGVRLPDDDNVRAFVRACGGALTATSANISGAEPARSAREVEESFPDGLDLIVDGGNVTVTQPSTVVDLTGPEPRLIREGAVSTDELKALWQ